MTKTGIVTLLRLDNQDPRVLVYHDSFRHFEFVFDLYVFVIITERYVVLVDTLTNPRAVQPILAHIVPYLETRQLLVVNTHADYDHAWGNQLFAGQSAQLPAPIIGTYGCAERMRSQETTDLLHVVRAKDEATFGGVTPTSPTILFDDTLTIDGGDLSLQLIATPGHTPDHASVFIPEIRLLIVGDAAEMPIPSIYGDVSRFRVSLQRMLDLNPSSALYSHLHPDTGLDAIGQNLAYLDRLEQRCRAALLQGDPFNIEPDNLEALIAFPFEKAIDVSASIANVAFYRTAHQQAIRAMLEHLGGRV